jgi:hypothetical protein
MILILPRQKQLLSSAYKLSLPALVIVFQVQPFVDKLDCWWEYFQFLLPVIIVRGARYLMGENLEVVLGRVFNFKLGSFVSK